MSLPPLPEPGIDGYQKTGPCGGYTDEQMHAFYAEGVRAGMERAAVIAEGAMQACYKAVNTDGVIHKGPWLRILGDAIAAIRAAAKQGGQG